MTGNLDEALKTLITEALPGLLGGTPPAVELDSSSDLFEVDPESAHAAASEPRPDDRTDEFPFDPDNPAGPYTLSQPPYPGPRRVRLTTEGGDRIPLRESEVIWDEVDPRVFMLDLRPTRYLSGAIGVLVLYGVTAVYTKIKAQQTLSLGLASSDADQLEQAEALVLAVMALNRQRLIDESRATYEDGDYGAEVEVKATRALREDEGLPIVRIRSPGRPLDPDRSIDIHIEVGA